jgi:phosphoglycerate dehydrogenase-like enzyme
MSARSSPRIGVIVHRSLARLLFCDQDRRRLETAGTVLWTDSENPISSANAISILHDADVAIGSWKTPTPDEQIISACPNLRLWEHAAGSVKALFGPHLRGRELTIASCAPAIAEQVAEFTLGLLITGLKRVWPNAIDNRRGVTPKPAHLKSLCNATVGIIAASQVGRRTIRLIQQFGARVLLFDPFVTREQAHELNVTKVDDLVALCRDSDAVVCHAPLVPATRKMLGAAHFSAMRDDAIFINNSRGGCVDEPALIEELQRGQLFAYLDVSDPEPAAADSPLRSLPNVALTSHIAGVADFRIGKQAVDDVEAFLSGKSPLYVVKEEMLDHVA